MSGEASAFFGILREKADLRQRVVLAAEALRAAADLAERSGAPRADVSRIRRWARELDLPEATRDGAIASDVEQMTGGNRNS